MTLEHGNPIVDDTAGYIAERRWPARWLPYECTVGRCMHAVAVDGGVYYCRDVLAPLRALVVELALTFGTFEALAVERNGRRIIAGVRGVAYETRPGSDRFRVYGRYLDDRPPLLVNVGTARAWLAVS